MKLAKNEHIVKEWDYAVSKQGLVKTQAKLTVTNERIISSTENSKELKRQEIPVAAVKSISVTKYNNSNILGIVLIVLGVLIAVMGFVPSFSAGAGINIITLLLGVILVFIGAYHLNRGSFDLVLTMDGRSEPAIVLGARNFVAKKNTHKVRVKINRDVVDDMLDSLGAIILDQQYAEDETETEKA